MPADLSPLTAYALGWLVYYTAHSLLAAPAPRARLSAAIPALAPRYRLFYNLFAVVTIVPMVIWFLSLRGPPLWEWRGVAGYIADGILVAALLGFWLTTRHYDMQVFLGTAVNSATERLAISPLHRFVRHPWYSLGLAIIWTRDMDAAWLVTVLCATVYVLIGLRLEERRLIDVYGQRYLEYRRRVPALIPHPWRYLGRAEAQTLLR